MGRELYLPIFQRQATQPELRSRNCFATWAKVTEKLLISPFLENILCHAYGRASWKEMVAPANNDVISDGSSCSLRVRL